MLVTVNLALGKPAVLDSVWEAADWNAGLAVDGNANSDAHDGFCAHNDGAETAGVQAYWQVDLQASYEISLLTIANRQDCCGSKTYQYTRLSHMNMRQSADEQTAF